MSAASAFAARKAAKALIAPSDGTVDRPVPNGHVSSENLFASEPPLKKRRQQKKSARPAEVKGTQEALEVQVASQDAIRLKQLAPAEAKAENLIALSQHPSIDDGPENEDVESSSEIEITVVVTRQLCTFVPTRDNVLVDTKREWRVRLGRKDTLAIIGQYDIWVRKGAISISGAIIHASPKLHRVYAPSTHSLPIIRPVYDPYGSDGQIVEISLLIFTTGIRLLRRLSPSFGRIWNGQEESMQGYKRSFAYLKESFEDPHHRPLRPLEVPIDWQAQIQRVVTSSESARILVCGPKNSGKSSLSRLISNALLSCQQTSSSPRAVLFLDLDPGQPEYTCPGEISLSKLHDFNLGVPFTHPTIFPYAGSLNLKAKYIGYLSPREDPTHYLACCTNLLNAYRKLSREFGMHALLINTPGWIQGTGLELLISLIRQSQPTKTMFTSTSGPDEVVASLAEECRSQKTDLIQVSSQPYPEIAAKTSSDLRAMQSMSYFHLTPSSEPEIDDGFRWDPRPLSDMRSLSVTYSGDKQGLYAVQILGDPQNSTLFNSIILGITVGIVILETKDPPTVEHTPDQIPYISGQIPLDPNHSYCLGQAYIRSISKQCFDLITPIPSENLYELWTNGAKIVLVKGRVDTPIWAYKEEIELMRSSASAHSAKGTDANVNGDGIDDDVEGTLKVKVERTPFLQLMEKGKTTAKARKIRRDIRYKPTADG